MADKKTVVETDENGKKSVRSEEDKGTYVHITTAVDIPGVGALRSSYNEPKNGDKTFGQHMTQQK